MRMADYEGRTPGPGVFKLYPVEQRWWSFADYAAVMGAVDYLKRRKCAAQGREVDDDGEPVVDFHVLEFGPGSSTLALLEGGASVVDAFEDNPDWSAVHRTRALAPHIAAGRVSITDYVWTDPVTLGPVTDRSGYDLGFIDGPRESTKRLAVLEYALERCDAVLIGIEGVSELRARVNEIGASETHWLQLKDTGPLAGTFALIGRRSAVPAEPETLEASVPTAADAPGVSVEPVDDAPGVMSAGEEPVDAAAPAAGAPDVGAPPHVQRSRRRRRGKRAQP